MKRRDEMRKEEKREKMKGEEKHVTVKRVYMLQGEGRMERKTE